MKFFADIRPNSNHPFHALNLLRLAAASLVLIAHAWRYTDRVESWNIFIGGFAVNVFFIISGFLIAKSWETCNDIRVYAINRLLRIFPALIVVVLFSAFVIGPLFTSASLLNYFSAGGTYRYLLNAVLTMHDTLPGVFTTNPHNDHVNGSLWTLSYEAGLYVWLAVLGLLCRRALRIAILSVYLALLVCNLVDAANWVGPDHYTVARNVMEFAAYFFAGSMVWMFRTGFVFRWYLASIAVLVLIFRNEIGCDGVIWFIALPYAVLWLGLRDLPQWKYLQHFQRNDYSYGVYIWGTPMQQSLVSIIGPASVWANLLMAIPPVGAAAFASWHLVEKRCLALKSRLRNRDAPVKLRSELAAK